MWMRSVILVIANLFKHIKPNRGSVTIVALVVMIVLGALGATLIKQSISGNKVSASYSDGIAAQYLAEAGIQHAKAEIEKQNYPTAATGANSLASVVASVTTNKIGNYSVLISPPVADVYTITSTGTVNGASRKVVKTLVNKDIIYQFAVHAGGNAPFGGVSIWPSANIVGDIGSNFNVGYGAFGTIAFLAGKITIDGNVEACTGIEKYLNFSPGLSVSGKQVGNSPNKRNIAVISFPSNYNQSPNILLASRESHTLSNKTYYTSGDLIIGHSQHINGNGTIYVNGDLILENGLFSSAYIDNNVSFIVKGDVILEPGSAMYGEVLVMACGRIWVGTGYGTDFRGGITTFPAYVNKGVLLANGNIFLNNYLMDPMYGSIISRGIVTLYGNSDIRYDAALMTRIKARGLLPSGVKE